MIIKAVPEDFRVDEILKISTQDRGDYAYIKVEKKLWTTLKVVQEMADRLKVSPQRFAFAGQKDRQGITKQYMSVFRVSDRAIEKLKIKDVKIKFLGYGAEPIYLGKLEGNKFTIVARDVKKKLHKVEAVPNYYDDQRFGGYRPNFHMVGKQTLLGNYEEAVKLLLLYPFPEETDHFKEARIYMDKNWKKWETFSLPKEMVIEKKVVGYLKKNPRDFKGALKALPRQLFTMLTHAYQSYLFNESLGQYLKTRYKDYKVVVYSVGNFIFVDEFEDLDWPIVGYETQLKGYQRRIIESIMRKEGISYDTFRSPIPALASKGITRKAFIKPGNLKIGTCKNKIQKVSFTLPKGSYATIVMRGLQ
jgi:tRNA pseudouridine13 synthase